MSESRISNTMRNIFFKMANQILTIILRFFSRSVFIAILGVEYLGINGLFSEILQVLSMADLGFGTAMVFSMYKPLAQQDHQKLAQLVGLYKKVYRIIALVIACIGVGLIPFLKYLVNMDQEIPHLIWYYLLYLANTIASYLVVYKTCILNADQRNYIVSKCNAIFNFASTVCCCIFLYLTRNFMVYLIVQVVFTYASNFVCSHIADKMYPYINSSVEKLPKSEENEIFRSVKSVFIYKLATTLISSTTNTMISVHLGTVVVGFYSNYSMIVSNISMMINIIFASVTASLGNLIVSENYQKNYQVYKTMQMTSYILGTFTISCVYSLINDLISVWLGDAYVLDAVSTFAIILNQYLAIILMPIWSYREATGIYRQTKYVMVMAALVNLTAAYILGKLIGLPGILLAVPIARVTTYFWYEPKLLFKQYFNQNVFAYYSSIARNLLITIVVGGLTTLLFSRFQPATWLELIAKAIGVAALALILTLALYCRDPELRNLVSIARSVIQRRSAK